MRNKSLFFFSFIQYKRTFIIEVLNNKLYHIFCEAMLALLTIIFFTKIFKNFYEKHNSLILNIYRFILEIEKRRIYFFKKVNIEN